MRISDWSSDVCSSDLTDRKAIDKAARDRNGREFQPIKHIGVATITAHEDSTGIFGTIGSPGSFPFGDGASDQLRCRRKDKVLRRAKLVEAIPLSPPCLEPRLQTHLRQQGKHGTESLWEKR